LPVDGIFLKPLRKKIESVLGTEEGAQSEAEGSMPGTHLEVILPRHVVIFMRLGSAICGRLMLLQGRSRFNLIIRTRSFALIHLDKTFLGGERKGNFDGRHQS